MLLILLTWVLLPFFFIPSGIAIKSIFNIENKGVFIPIFLGVFFQCFILTCCSFFFKIGLVAFLINSIVQIGFTIWKTKEISKTIKETVSDLKSLPNLSKFTIIFILLFSLIKCSQVPFIIDNESYYLQTIKWINEYGFVKGLGNLHIFFAQCSTFHVLQAGFNFNYLTDRINDINGFFLLISSCYYLIELEKKYEEKGQIHWIGLIVIFNILFFQFINSPSPDLLIILLSQVIFYLYLEKDNNFSNFKIITILLLSLTFIKITIAPFGLLILFILANEKRRILFFVIFSIVITMSLILKNIIITGHPFYPFNLIYLNLDWRIPNVSINFISEVTRNTGYFKGVQYENPSLYLKLTSWLKIGGINQFFNFGIFLLFITTLLLKEISNKLKLKILYAVLLFHFIILLLTSPQFRFFLPEFVFLFVLVMSSIINYFKISINNIRILLLISILLPLVLIEFIDYKNFTPNKFHQNREHYKWSQIFIPEKNSKYANLKFETIKEGNLEYNSPEYNFFFYGTGNGELPCVNKVQVNYFKNNFFIIPQQRSKFIKDGFYSKEINDTKRNKILP